MESSTSATSNAIGWQSASPDQSWLSLTCCKTLIGSNEGSCSHGQQCEGWQCNRKRKCVTRGQCLGLGNWAAMSRRKHASAKRCSKMDQRSEEQECGRRSKCDGISDRWPEVERSKTAQLHIGSSGSPGNMNSFIASNKLIWVLCFIWKQASWLLLTRKEPSAFVKPTTQFLKNFKFK